MLRSVAIRADASTLIGSGHVMRNLVLAEEFRKHGIEAYFICRAHEGHLQELIEKRGFSVYVLPAPASTSALEEGPYAQWLGVPWERDADETSVILRAHPADWLIVDHYALDAAWESRLRDFVPHIMAIDDLAERCHSTDILLDSNWHAHPKDRYDVWVPPTTTLLLGPTYALLPDVLLQALPQRRVRTGPIARLLIFFGGSDPCRLTEVALEAVQEEADLFVDVIVGASNPRAAAIQALAAQRPNTAFHQQIPYIIDLMQKADFAIGGGGVASWERVLLGLPSMVIPWAVNQEPATRVLAEHGLLKRLDPSTATKNVLKETLTYFRTHPKELQQMSQRALDFTQAFTQSGARQVVRALEAYPQTLQAAGSSR